jgi:hypothetical protein
VSPGVGFAPGAGRTQCTVLDTWSDWDLPGRSEVMPASIEVLSIPEMAWPMALLRTRHRRRDGPSPRPCRGARRCPPARPGHRGVTERRRTQPWNRYGCAHLQFASASPTTGRWLLSSPLRRETLPGLSERGQAPRCTASVRCLRKRRVGTRGSPDSRARQVPAGTDRDDRRG